MLLGTVERRGAVGWDAILGKQDDAAEKTCNCFSRGI
jgi:hypothetical protein